MTDFRKAILEEMQKVREVEKEFIEKNVVFDTDSLSYVDELVRDFDFLLRSVPHFDEKMVLDMGVGKGWSSFILSKFFKEVKAVDIEITIGEQLGITKPRWQEKLWNEWIKFRDNLEFSFFDGWHIPYKDNSFDVVVAIAVLEHVDEHISDNFSRHKWLKEVNRVLRPGGILFISKCPNRYSYQEFITRLLGLPSHKKRFSKKELVKLLESSGFSVEKLERRHAFIDFPPLLGLWNKIYPALKPISALLSITPLRLFYHHFRVLARKPENQHHNDAQNY